MKKGKTATAPRIGDQSAQFYPTVFQSVNAGLEYTLDSFPALYRRTLHDLRGKFTDGELSLIIDVFNATMLIPGMAGQHIEAQVSDGIALDRLDQKWDIPGSELLDKLRSLTIFEKSCLELWANGFWYRANTEESPDLDAWVGQLKK